MLVCVLVVPLVLAAGSPGPTPPAMQDEGALEEARERAHEQTAMALDTVDRARADGDTDAARAELARSLELLGALREREPDLATCALLHRIASVAYGLGALETTLEAMEWQVRWREALHPPGHPDLLAVWGNLAVTRRALGDLGGALELDRTVLAAREAELGEDDVALHYARQSVAVSLYTLGEHAEAHELLEGVVAALERLLPADHPRLLIARDNLGVVRRAVGDLRGAHELQAALVESYERTLPPDHRDLLSARSNLAVTLDLLGDVEGSIALTESVLAARERLLPEGHPDLLRSRQNLAVAKRAIGDFEAARALFESVAEAQLARLPADHPDLLDALGNLAIARKDAGDLAGALALEEQVLDGCERTRPTDDPRVLDARRNLANTRRLLGDLTGALALQEGVHAAYARLFPADHPDVLAARENLAVTKVALRDFEGAHALIAAVLDVRERELPDDHPDLLRARTNLASVLTEVGDAERALALERSVLAACERLYPPHHPHRLRARRNLAGTLGLMGDHDAARAMLEEVVAASARLLPADHVDLLDVRQNLLTACYAAGDRERVRELLGEELDGSSQRLVAALGSAPREAREVAQQESRRIAQALFLAEQTGFELEPLVALVETRRHVATAGAGARHGDDAELAALGERVARARVEINDRVLAGPAKGESEETWRAAVRRASSERDRALAERNARLRALGAFAGELDAPSIAAALPPDGLAVGYLRYDRWRRDPETNEVQTGRDALLALVVEPSGAVHRVELGPLEPLAELVRAYRAGVAASRTGMRGFGSAEATQDGAADLQALGRELRAAILDPVLAAVELPPGGTVHVCLDDLLHLVPLDALPTQGADGEDGAASWVGDALRVRDEVSFARLVGPGPEVAAAPASSTARSEPAAAGGDLLVVGDVDFGAPAAEDASAPSARAAPFGEWAPLAGTRGELDAIAALYAVAFGTEPLRLSGRDATKAALASAVAGRRVVHLATHGWFAPETVLSTARATAADAGSARSGAERTVRGFAPMTLCGLVLAGANRGSDALGRVPGLLSAEELAGWDLSACELAVLSACETNVGLHRAGQGILSLRAALHAAGARTSITSLWKVDDAATRRLFEVFYANLWLAGLPKAEALWAAKRALRDEGAPVSDWAAWVLTGRPE